MSRTKFHPKSGEICQYSKRWKFLITFGEPFPGWLFTPIVSLMKLVWLGLIRLPGWWCTDPFWSSHRSALLRRWSPSCPSPLKLWGCLRLARSWASRPMWPGPRPPLWRRSSYKKWSRFAEARVVKVGNDGRSHMRHFNAKRFRKG